MQTWAPRWCEQGWLGPSSATAEATFSKAEEKAAGSAFIPTTASPRGVGGRVAARAGFLAARLVSPEIRLIVANGGEIDSASHFGGVSNAEGVGAP